MSEVPAGPPAPPSPHQPQPTAVPATYAQAPSFGPAFAPSAPQQAVAQQAGEPEAFGQQAVAAQPVPTEAYQAPQPPARGRLRWLWLTAGAAVVAGLAGLSAYLIVVSQQWSGRVDELTVIADDLGTQVADQTAARLAAEEQAATLQAQLDTATARITDLANEEANATDHETYWIELVDAMISCEEGWVDHSTVLKGQQRYVDTTTAAAEAELVSYCDGVKSDYVTFKAEIGK